MYRNVKVMKAHYKMAHSQLATSSSVEQGNSRSVNLLEASKLLQHLGTSKIHHLEPAKETHHQLLDSSRESHFQLPEASKSMHQLTSALAHTSAAQQTALTLPHGPTALQSTIVPLSAALQTSGAHIADQSSGIHGAGLVAKVYSERDWINIEKGLDDRHKVHDQTVQVLHLSGSQY
jgi:hypothetical protein